MNRLTGRPRPAPVPAGAVPAGRNPPRNEAGLPPSPNRLGSILCVVGLGLTGLLLQGKTGEDIARFGAYGALLSFGISLAMDLRRGIQNLIRTDVMALMALYFLTLAEFLVKQQGYNWQAALEPTRLATLACLWGYAGMVIGRHLVPPARQHPFSELFQLPVPGSALFAMFWLCFIFGYLYMLVSVHFNVTNMILYFMEPRFYQPWQRGRLGDWKALLFETSMILYLVPPLGGVLLARRARFSKFQIFLVMLAVLFTLFYGFSSGTRNVFLSFLVTFLIGYCFAANRRQMKEIVVLGAITVVLLLVSTKMMLEFRNVGLRSYMIFGLYKVNSRPTDEGALAVDNNLSAISRVADYFPRSHAYTNLEQPFLALIHPIPRVLWRSKPEGSVVSVEDIVRAKGWTVATSVIGEEYMMHGCIAVFFMSVFFGACCAWWNLLASPKNSEFGILVYASGFFSAVITMRSMVWCSTALLPTLAGLLLGYVMLLRDRMRPKPAPVPAPPPRRNAPVPAPH